MGETNYRVPAVEKSVNLIQILCASDMPMTLSEIAKAVGTNNNMAYRILRTLESEGWVIQEKPGPTYRMSLKPFHYTSMPVSKMDLTSAALGPIREFWQEYKECCFLGVLDGDRVLYLETMDPVGGPVRVSVARGERYVMHTAAPGKVLMAYDSNAAEVVMSQKMERFTENTICTKAAMKKELKKIQECGYALDNEEGARGLVCMAVPIFNSTGDIVGSFGISVLTVNYADIDVMFEKLGADVIEVGRKASEILGFVP